MNQVAHIEVELVQEHTPDGEERLQVFFDRLIEQALCNLEQE